jgi:hypothetical protein
LGLAGSLTNKIELPVRAPIEAVKVITPAPQRLAVVFATIGIEGVVAAAVLTFTLLLSQPPSIPAATQNSLLVPRAIGAEVKVAGEVEKLATGNPPNSAS